MKLRLAGSVGSGKTNNKKDVKLVQALLNVHLRRECSMELEVSGKCGDDTIVAITELQQYVLKMTKPDGWVGPSGGTFRKLRAILKTALQIPRSVIKPDKGLITFNAEGKEGGFYHSRALHTPGPWSGVTLGRGYDMRDKSAGKIIRELTQVGVSARNAQKVSKGHGLRGERARQFVIDKDLLDFSVTPLQQKKLFLISYEDMVSDVKRISRGTKNVGDYGAVDWGKLNGGIKDIVFDLRYRGDYTIAARVIIQKNVACNDLKAFKKAMKNRAFWVDKQGVPEVRFNERIAWLNK